MATEINRRKLIRLSSAYLISSLVPQFLNLALTPIFTRYLDASQLGIVFQAARIGGPLAIIVQLGFYSVLKGRYFQVELAERGTWVRTVFTGQLLTSFVFCALVSAVGFLPVMILPAGWTTGSETVIAEVILPGLPLPTYWVLTVWLLATWQALFTSVDTFASGVAQLNEQAKTSVALNWLYYGLQAIFGLIVVVGLGGLGLARQATLVAAAAITAIVGLLTLIPRAKGRFDRKILRVAFIKGLGFVPHAFVVRMPQAVNAWLLGRYWGSAANGLFGAAMILPALSEVYFRAVSNAVYPTLARLMAEGTAESRRRQARIYTLLVLAITALLLGIAVSAPLVLRLLLAPSYWEAIDYVPVLAFAWMFYGLYLCAGQPVYFVGGGWWLSTASTAAAAAHFLVALFAIETHAIRGACWSLVAGHFVLFVTAAWAGNRLYPLPWEYRKIVATILTAGLISVADYWLCRPLEWYTSMPVKAALIAAWLPALVAAGVISADDIRRGLSLVRQRIRRR